MCRSLEPAVAAFGRNPRVLLRTFRRGPRRRRLGGRRRAGQPVRGRARRRRDRAREGHLQHGQHSSSPCLPPPSARRGIRESPVSAPCMPENRARGGRVARETSRLRSCARVAAADGARGAATVTSLVAPGESEAYHFCGHIYTTDSCPHPTGLPRIDSRGFPLRAADGHPIDDLGRLVNGEGRAVDEDERPLTDADGRPLPTARAPRVRRRRGRVPASRPRSTARGSAAAAGTSASSSTAARAASAGSTATPR